MSVKNLVFRNILNKDNNEFSILFSDHNFELKECTIFKCDGVIDKIKTNIKNEWIYFLLFLNNFNEICFLKFNLENLSNHLKPNTNEMKILNTTSNLTLRNIKINYECVYYLYKKFPNKKYFNHKIKIKLIYYSSDEIIYAGLIYQYTITKIAINLKSNYTSTKNFRYSGFDIDKFLLSNSENSFTGKDIEVIISVYYDKKEKEYLNFHKIHLPNLESEIILKHESLMIKKDDEIKYKFFTYGKIYNLFFKYEQTLTLICFDSNFKIILESEIQEQYYIEYFKFFEVEKKLFLGLCFNEKFLNVYQINDQTSKLDFYNKFQIPTECSILSNYIIYNFPDEIFLIINNFSLYKLNIRKNLVSFIKNSENILICNDDQHEKLDETLFAESLIFKENKIISTNSEFIYHKSLNTKHFKIYCKFTELKIDKRIKINNYDGLEILEIFDKLNLLISIGSKTSLIDYKEDKILLETTEKISNFYFDEKSCELILFLNHSINILFQNNKKISKIKYPLDGYKEIFVSVKENICYILIQDRFFYLNEKREIKEFVENNDSKLISKLHSDIFMNKENIISKFNNSLIYLIKKSVKLKYFIIQNMKIRNAKLNLKENYSTIQDIKHNEKHIFTLEISSINIFFYTIQNENIEFSNVYTIELQSCFLTQINMKICEYDNSFNFFIYNKNNYKEVQSIISFNHKKNQHKILKNFTSNNDKINIKVTDRNLLLYSTLYNKDKQINIYSNPIYIQDNYIQKISSLKTFILESVIKYKFFNNKFLVIYTGSNQKNFNTGEGDMFEKLTLHILDIENSYTSILKFNIQEYLIDFDILMKPNYFILILMIKNKYLKEKFLINFKFESIFNFSSKKYLFGECSKNFIQKGIDNDHDFMIKIDSLLEKTDTNYIYDLNIKKVLKIDNALFTNLKIIQELQMVLLFSNYGFFKIFNLDENLNLEEIYDSCYSSHLLEISNLKKEYENSEDLIKIFKEDDEKKFLECYEFIDCFNFKTYNSKLNIKLEQFSSTTSIEYKEDYIFFILNFGIIVFKLTKDNYTSNNMIKFYQQLSFESRLEISSYKNSNIIQDKVFVNFENLNYSIKYEKDKFLFI